MLAINALDWQISAQRLWYTSQTGLHWLATDLTEYLVSYVVVLDYDTACSTSTRQPSDLRATAHSVSFLIDFD